MSAILSPVFATAPWAHQRAGLDFALARKGAMLAFDMGCGKSKVAIDLIQNTRPAMTLIIAPKSVLRVWPREFEKHCAAPAQYLVRPLIQGSIAQRTKYAEAQSRFAQTTHKSLVLIANYEMVFRDPFYSWAHGRKWDLLICDEIHRIKSASGKASRALSRIAPRATRRLGLTGTPMPHSPLDIYAQARFLDPNIFGYSALAFRHKYAVFHPLFKSKVVKFINQDDLQERFHRLALRVRKTDVLDLPPFTHEEILVDLGPRARTAYAGLQDDLIASIASGEVTAANALVKLLRLQQCTSGYLRADDATTPEILDTAKLDALTDLLTDLPPAEPVVVFARFRHDLDQIARAAQNAGTTCAEFSGRRDELSEWLSGARSVLACQIQSGREGLDFSRAAYCVYYSLGFSGGDYQQSLARVHRPGQTRPVTYYHLIAENTVDQTVYAAMRQKLNIVSAIVDTYKEA